MKKKTGFWVLVLVAAVAVILGFRAGCSNEEEHADPSSNVSSRSARASDKSGNKASRTGPRQRPSRASSTEETEPETESADVQEEEGEEAEPLTEEEKREREEEAQVEAFDALTDKWMELTSDDKGVTMEDVRQFAEQFRKVPKDRKDECVHRALNLIPDENVMLLAGILMDKTQDKEILETVYNDILNRDEDVKKPILQQIFKDREHPCWADTAWILDVTGELPAGKQDQKQDQ